MPTGDGWKLATICQNPPKGRAKMDLHAQEAMRLNLILAETTVDIVEASSEAWVAEIMGKIH